MKTTPRGLSFVIGVAVGAALAGSVAVAATFHIPTGGTAVIAPGGAHVVFAPPKGTNFSELVFGSLGADCVYWRGADPLGIEPKNEPTLTCGRGWGSQDTWNHSRRLLITPYRIFVWNASGQVVYSATRTP